MASPQFYHHAVAANPLPMAAKQALSSLLLLKSPFSSSISRPAKSHYHRHRCYSNRVNVCVDDKELRSPDLVALEYAELNLTDKISGVIPFQIKSYVVYVRAFPSSPCLVFLLGTEGWFFFSGTRSC